MCLVGVALACLVGIAEWAALLPAAFGVAVATLIINPVRRARRRR